MFKMAGVILLAYFAMVGVVYVMQPQLLYMPSSASFTTPQEQGLAYEDVRLETEDGETLHAWYVPSQADRGTVLFAHGNAGNITHRMDSIRIWHDLGFNTLIFDYRGYGESTGSPNEEGTYRDAAAAWTWLTDERNKSAGDIILFGRSLGAAVVTELATRTEPGALILESPFISVPELGAKLYPWLPVRTLSRFDYPIRDRMDEVHSPVLVIHSRDDDIVPFEQGRAVFEAANEPKTFFELSGGHNDGFLRAGDAYPQALDSFLRDVGL